MGIFSKYTFFPIVKIAQYSFNLLEYVDYYRSNLPNVVILIPSDDVFVKGGHRRPIANKFLLEVVLRSLDENCIKYTSNKYFILFLYFLFKLKLIKIHKKSENNNVQEFYSAGYFLTSMPQYASRESAYNRNVSFCSLTSDESNLGKKILNENSIDEKSIFVAMHTRDNAYGSNLKGTNYGDIGGHNFRNSNFEDLFSSCEYLNSKGMQTFRMGADQFSIENINKKDYIVDYSNSFRSEFMDIYIISKCKFFVGSTSGIWGTPYLFNTPILGVNFIPVYDSTMSSRDMWIPKKLWIKKEKRYMTFKEMFSIDRKKYFSDRFYHDNGLEVVDNDSDELLNAIMDMNSFVDGELVFSDKDNWLWHKFKSTLPEGHYNVSGNKSRVCPSFLQRNQKFLL